MAVVTQIQVRRGTAAQWTSANPTLASGEQGFETDTLKLKIGDGSTAWNSLGYVATGATGTVTSVTAGTGLSGGTITSTGTIAIDSTVATLTGSQTLTNKTLTAPVISSISNSGTVTLPTGSVTLASLTGTETFTNKTLTDPKINLAFDAETASYTAVLANNGQVVTMDNASANTFSIPTNASVAFPVGTQINVIQIGAGQTTIQAVTSGTTTIQSTGASAAAPKLRARYSMATCIKASTDLWYVAGDIS
jgi:hypothetical protein